MLMLIVLTATKRLSAPRPCLKSGTREAHMSLKQEPARECTFEGWPIGTQPPEEKPIRTGWPLKKSSFPNRHARRSSNLTCSWGFRAPRNWAGERDPPPPREARKPATSASREALPAEMGRGGPRSQAPPTARPRPGGCPFPTPRLVPARLRPTGSPARPAQGLTPWPGPLASRSVRGAREETGPAPHHWPSDPTASVKAPGLPLGRPTVPRGPRSPSVPPRSFAPHRGL